MSEIDQQFIEYVVKSLVGKPDAVQVKRTIDEKGVLLELTVDPDDLGRVIGKRGATAQSLRTLLRALGTKNDARYNLKIIDNGPLDHGHNDRPSEKQDAPPPESQPSDDTTNDTTDDEAAKDDIKDTPEEQPAPPPVPEDKPADEAPAAEEAEDQASDRLAQTRKELADLDDLDL